MPVVTIPDVGEVTFPESMSMEDIHREAGNLYTKARSSLTRSPGAQEPPPPTEAPSGQWQGPPQPPGYMGEQIPNTEQGLRDSMRAMTAENWNKGPGNEDQRLALQMQQGSGEQVDRGIPFAPQPGDTGFADVISSFGSFGGPDFPVANPDYGTKEAVLSGTLAAAGGRAADSPTVPLSGLVPGPEAIQGLVDSSGVESKPGLAANVTAGTALSAAKQLEGLTTPRNLAILGVMAAAPPWVGRAIAGAFGAETFYHMPDLIRQAESAVRNGDARDVSEAITTLAGNALIGGALVTHAVKPSKFTDTTRHLHNGGNQSDQTPIALSSVDVNKPQEATPIPAGTVQGGVRLETPDLRQGQPAPAQQAVNAAKSELAVADHAFQEAEKGGSRLETARTLARRQEAVDALTAAEANLARARAAQSAARAGTSQQAADNADAFVRRATGELEAAKASAEGPAPEATERLSAKQLKEKRAANSAITKKGIVLDAGVGETGTFWRSGAPPESGKSYNSREQHEEAGVSVYARPEASSFAGLADRPWYRITGKVVGLGSDGEPVVEVLSSRKLSTAQLDADRRLLRSAFPFPRVVPGDVIEQTRKGKSPIRIVVDEVGTGSFSGRHPGHIDEPRWSVVKQHVFPDEGDVKVVGSVMDYDADKFWRSQNAREFLGPLRLAYLREFPDKASQQTKSEPATTPTDTLPEGASAGPGGAAAGEPGTYDPRQQLIDALDAVPPAPVRTRLSWKAKVVDAWENAGGGTKLEAALAHTKAVTDSLADTFTNAGRRPVGETLGRLVPKTVEDIYNQLPKRGEIEQQVGTLDWLLQKSSEYHRRVSKALERRIPDKVDRDAMAFGMEMGLEGAKIPDIRRLLEDDRLGVLVDKDGKPFKLKPYVRRSLERATDLSPELVQEIQLLRQHYGQRAEEAQASGVLGELLDDYFTHMWKVKKTSDLFGSLANAVGRGEVDTFFPYSRQRKISTLLEGIRLGYEPILDVSKVVPRYGHILDKAMASRDFLKAIRHLREADGNPTIILSGAHKPVGEVVPGETLPGVVDDFFRADAVLYRPKGKVAPKDAAGNPINTDGYTAVNSPAMRGWRYVDKNEAGLPIYAEGDLLVHPDAYPRLRYMMDKETLRPTGPLWSGLRALNRVNAEYKAAKLGGIPSPFHAVHVGSHALFHGNVRGALEAGKHMISFGKLGNLDIDLGNPKTQFAIEKGGLKLFAEPHELKMFDEYMNQGPLVQKIPGIGTYAKIYSEYTFQRFIPFLKLTTFDMVYARNMKWFADDLAAGKVTREQLAARAGDAVNNAFGELNRKWLGVHGRDPRLQQALQAAFLAPDFGEARLRFVAKAFTKYGKEERQALLAGSWSPKMVGQAVTLYMLARTLNMLSTGNPQFDRKHIFEVKVGGKWYGIRSVVGDVAHLTDDFRRFATHRLSWLFRAGLEATTGRDMGGHKRTGGEVLKDILLEPATPIPLASLTEPDRDWKDSLMQSVGLTSRPDRPEPYYFVKGRNIASRTDYEDYLNTVARDAKGKANPMKWAIERMREDGIDPRLLQTTRTDPKTGVTTQRHDSAPAKVQSKLNRK